jgi:MOSC domain-containing protein
MMGCRPLRGLRACISMLTWGLRPRLYAVARFASFVILLSVIIHLGHVHQLARYPVKSMAGVETSSAFLGWHGLQGDRRFAFRRLNDKSGFPWLSASRLPELLLYQPHGFDEDAEEPTHVHTPEGLDLAIGSAELQESVAEKFGSPLELMKLKHGIFDDASVSVINLATIAAIGREAGQDLDTRRFRANIVIASDSTEPFLEDGWIGGRLVFGSDEAGPIVSITMRDLRCVMINLDPDTAKQDPRIMKAAISLNENNAGAYGTVARTGQISVGESVSLLVET